MELLGPSVKDCATGPVAVTTVVRVVLQMVCVALRLHLPILVYLKSAIAFRLGAYTQTWFRSSGY
jgi:hypothetical protein